MRRIHQLLLSAPTRPLIHRGQTLLEDALHTASIPAADRGELLLIRQLNVGTIHPSQSATTLSLQIEKQIQQLSVTAIPGTYPDAATASVVSFPDTLTAYGHFAHRLAAGDSLQAWFWQQLLPAWHPAQPSQTAAVTLLTHLAQHPLGPLATSIVLQTLESQTTLSQFLQLIQPEDGSTLLALHGWTPQANLCSAPLTLKELVSLQALPHYPSLDWPLQEARSQWLITLGLIAKDRSITEPTAAVRELYQHIDSHYARQTKAPASTQPPVTETTSPVHQPNKTQAPSKKATEQPFLTQQQATNDVTLTIDKPTQYGGIGYLLNALDHLNFARYLAQHRYPTLFPYQLLHYIALRQHCDPTDLLFSLEPPAYLSSEGLPSLANPRNTHIDYCPYHAWHSALRKYILRHTGLSLNAVIRRPARFSLTPSHFDLVFPLSQVDIRLRKAGLDINPGWLSWFGRVVQFHYEKS